MFVEKCRDISEKIHAAYARNNTRATSVRRQLRDSSSCSPDCGSILPHKRVDFGADTDTDSLFSRGVSDHVLDVLAEV